jgi:hypothetical protein
MCYRFMRIVTNAAAQHSSETAGKGEAMAPLQDLEAPGREVDLGDWNPGTGQMILYRFAGSKQVNRAREARFPDLLQPHASHFPTLHTPLPFIL